MRRATFLVVELEQPEGLSTRKLVLETAKHNVLTAYSGREGLEILKDHPVTAVVVYHGVNDVPPAKLIPQMKRMRPEVPVVALSPSISRTYKGADHVVPSHEPPELLALLERIITAEDRQ